MVVSEKFAISADNVSAVAPVSIPFCTVELYASLTGLPLGVCQAHADKRLIPMFRLGKRRVVNLELLRKQALEQEFVL